MAPGMYSDRASPTRVLTKGAKYGTPISLKAIVPLLMICTPTLKARENGLKKVPWYQRVEDRIGTLDFAMMDWWYVK